VIFGLELRVDIGPYHQEAGAARLGHRSLLSSLPAGYLTSLPRSKRGQTVAIVKASRQARMAGISGQSVMQGDSKRIIREWNREIEDEIRRETARRNAAGLWKAVAWAGLWVLWLGLLVALVVRTRTIG
jgi:hypothetical protein